MNSHVVSAVNAALSAKWVSSREKQGIDSSLVLKPISELGFVERLKLGSSKLVMTYRARDDNGRDFFAYIFCDKDGVIRMQRDFWERKSGAAKDYGKVLYIDYVKDPDQKAIDFLKRWCDENGGEILP